MFKIFILILYLIIFIIWFSFWENKDNDCTYISTLKTTNIKDNSIKNNKEIDEKVYTQALKNLEKYCNADTDVLESRIFWNHLLDIAFRKIDAIEWLTYWTQTDEQWQSWRKYLNDIEKEYQTPPENIYNKFIEYWWKADANILWNTGTLYGKYILVCDEIKNIYDIITYSKTYNWIQLIPSIFYEKCINLANIRYNNELNLVEQIMFQNHYNIVNKTLFKTFNQIYWKEFIDLFDKFMIALWNYEYMVRRFIKVTDANTY